MRAVDLVRLSLGLLFVIGVWILGRLRKRTAGRLLMLIGGLHILGGAWVGRGPLERMVREGFLGAADSALAHVAAQMEKELVFWFILWGIVTCIWLSDSIGEIFYAGRSGDPSVGTPLLSLLWTLERFPCLES